MQIRCLVIDDEPLARRLVESHIEKLPLFSKVTYCKNAIEALKILNKEEYDLLLLDVQMPELNGIAFLKSLAHPPKVILITAYRDFAVDAFDLDVIDYLLKPISFEKFVRAINKFLERSGPPHPALKTDNQMNEIILVRSERKIIRLPIVDIYYIESIKDYLKIFTSYRVILTKEPISSIQSRLAAHQFVRVHRSFLVAVQKVEAFNHEFIEILGKQLPYGRKHKENALNKLEQS